MSLSSQPHTIFFAFVSGGIGGGQRVGLAVAARLASDHRIVAIAPDDGPSLEEFRSLGGESIVLGPIRTYDLGLVRRIAQIVGAGDDPCVYTHTVLAHEAVFGRAAKQAGARLVLHRHIRGSLSPNPVTRMYQSFLWRRAVAYAHEIICVSEEVREQVTALTGRVAHVVPNGVALTPDAGSSVQNQPPVIGYIGRFDENKRLEDFISAAAIVRREIRDVRFLVVGGAPPGDPYTDRCLGLISELDLADAIELTGPAPAHEIMATLDVFVLPSVLEGHPLVLLEAMALGKAIVATDIGGVRESITDGEHGLVVPARDPEALARATLRFLTEPELRARMGAAARERAAHEFTEKKMVDRLVPIVLGADR